MVDRAWRLDREMMMMLADTHACPCMCLRPNHHLFLEREHRYTSLTAAGASFDALGCDAPHSFLVFFGVRFQKARRIDVRRAVKVWVAQQRLDARQYHSNRVNRLPFVLDDVKAQVSVREDLRGGEQLAPPNAPRVNIAALVRENEARRNWRRNDRVCPALTLGWNISVVNRTRGALSGY